MKTRIEKVTIVETDETGATTSVVDRYNKKKKRKKSTGWLAIPETMVRQGLDAGAKSMKALQDSHRRSNRKRQNGWLMDLGPNLVKAASKGRKRIKVQRLFLGK